MSRRGSLIVTFRLIATVAPMLIATDAALAQNVNIQHATLGETNQRTSEVSTEELRRILANGSAVVVDSRKHSEYVMSHIPGAKNPALRPGALTSEFAAEVMRLAGDDKSTSLVVYCNGEFCQASRRLANQLVDAGFTSVRRYQLGIAVWRALGGVTEIEIDGITRIFNVDRTAAFFDARTPEEFSGGSLPGARNIPMGTTKFEGTDLLPNDDFNTRIVIFGRDGSQARTVAEAIARAARHNISYFPGTYDALRAALK